MRLATLVVLAQGALLCACVSLPKADNPNDPPSRTYTSTKPVAVVADCIEHAWPTGMKVLTGEKPRVDRLPAPAGARKMVLMVGTSPDHQALVEPAGRGSRTGIWTLGTYFGGTPAQIKAAEACQ